MDVHRARVHIRVHVYMSMDVYHVDKVLLSARLVPVLVQEYGTRAVRTRVQNTCTGTLRSDFTCTQASSAMASSVLHTVETGKAVQFGWRLC